MKWDKEALEALAQIPLPPVMSHLARFDAEKRAQMNHRDVVTSDIVRQTRRGYEKLLGREAVELIEKMTRGEPVDIPDEFFDEQTGELYSIQLCPAKFGACTKQKREMMLASLRAVRAKLKEMDINHIMLQKAVPPVMSHHAFRVAITGCSNCCLSPYFSDFGIIAVYRPEVMSDGCVGCGECLERCAENAIILHGETVEIDFRKCLLCGGCADVCPKGVIRADARGYKVVAGGTGARHPVIAKTMAEWTDADGIMDILRDSLQRFKNQDSKGGELSFHEVT